MEAQAGLRRTMEKYMRTCRLILVASSLSKVIPAVRSRCLCLRIAAPTVPEIRTVLDKIAVAEKFTLTPQFATQLAKKANRNLRRAILMLETCKAEQYPFVQGQRLPVPDWEAFILTLAQRVRAMLSLSLHRLSLGRLWPSRRPSACSRCGPSSTSC